MCILFIAIEQHPDYPIIICANRDEFHQRPTQNMHYWPEQNILAGKDLQAGGTWMGLSPNGNFSALTNFRRPANFDDKKRSRGDLVVKALTTNNQNTQQYLTKNSEQYNDFNLVFGQLNNLQAFDSVNKKFVTLKQGFHSICNGALDDIWPKMASGLKALEALVTAKKVNIEALFSVMGNQDTAEEEHLPDTGLNAELELLLSSIFIVSDEYGTRSTAVILQNTSGNIEVYERNYNNKAKQLNQQKFQTKRDELIFG